MLAHTSNRCLGGSRKTVGAQPPTRGETSLCWRSCFSHPNHTWKAKQPIVDNSGPVCAKPARNSLELAHDYRSLAFQAGTAASNMQKQNAHIGNGKPKSAQELGA